MMDTFPEKFSSNQKGIGSIISRLLPSLVETRLTATGHSGIFQLRVQRSVCNRANESHLAIDASKIKEWQIHDCFLRRRIACKPLVL